MQVQLPYLASNKNIVSLFDKIRTAKVPDTITTSYLGKTFGLSSSNDRALITLLKTLGFLDASGKPTSDYSKLKHDKSARIAIAHAIRKAYEPLFSSNENANELTGDDLKGLIGQVAGTDESMTGRIVGTFKALCSVADFKSSLPQGDEPEKNKDKGEIHDDDKDTQDRPKGLRPDFHYNIQIHLPSNGSEETYINIFNAVRKVFK